MELENKLGFVKKSNRLNKLLNEIEVQSQKIVSLDKNNSCEIVNIAENISQLVENGKNFLIDL